MLVLAAGCRSILGISDPGVIGDASSAIDTMIDGGDAAASCTSFSTLLDTCALPAGGLFPPTATLYNADTGEVTVGGATQSIIHLTVMTTAGTTVDAIPVTRFIQDADSTLRITGKLPVAFVATGEIEISGRLDASAGGAGAGCDAAGTGTDGLSHGTTGDGGGGGGGAVAGAAGGAGNGSTHSSGGAAEPGLAGGCAGGDGGLIDIPIAAGGGVIYLISAQRIDVNGLVDASGGGGQGGISMGGNRGGGGGGAAGGSLIFEAPSLVTAGLINATGGGGGGGGSTFSSGGNPGKLGSSGGQGGTGAAGNDGGHGGDGTLNAVPGADGNISDGGGGGGGATGRIHIIASLTNNGTIAPPPF